MKVSVSLPEDDVRFLDDYATRAGGESRSAVIQHAIGLLRHASLEDAYVEAMDEWDRGADAEIWESAAADGLGDATG